MPKKKRKTYQVRVGEEAYFRLKAEALKKNATITKILDEKVNK